MVDLTFIITISGEKAVHVHNELASTKLLMKSRANEIIYAPN